LHLLEVAAELLFEQKFSKAKYINVLADLLPQVLTFLSIQYSLLYTEVGQPLYIEIQSAVQMKVLRNR